MPAGAGHTLQKISVGPPVRGHVASDHIAFRIDSVSFAGSRSRNIDRDELAIAQDKTVLVSVLIVIEANEVTFGIHAGNPGESGVGNVDGFELSTRQHKTVKYGVAAEVGTDYLTAVEDHGRKCSHGARDVHQREVAVAEEVTMPMQEVAADEFDSDHVTSIADTEAQRRGLGRI